MCFVGATLANTESPPAELQGNHDEQETGGAEGQSEQEARGGGGQGREGRARGNEGGERERERERSCSFHNVP